MVAILASLFLNSATKILRQALGERRLTKNAHKEHGMRTLCKLVLVSGVAMATAAFPAMAQQGQQQMPMGQGGMMGPSGTGMMNQSTTS